MAVRIRMKRMGRRNRPFFRIGAFDARTPRDGKAIENLGIYDPLNPDIDQQVRLNVERIVYWLQQGAQPSETVASFLKKFQITKDGAPEQPIKLSDVNKSKKPAKAAADAPAEPEKTEPAEAEPQETPDAQ